MVYMKGTEFYVVGYCFCTGYHSVHFFFGVVAPEVGFVISIPTCRCARGQFKSEEKSQQLSTTPHFCGFQLSGINS